MPATKKINKLLIFALILTPLIAAAVFVAGYCFYSKDRISADTATTTKMGVGVTIPGSTTSGNRYSVEEYVRGLYAFSMKVAVALSFLMIIYAGYKYMTSRGDSGMINEAKDILFSTLMGAALLMLCVMVAHVAGLKVNFIKPT